MSSEPGDAYTGRATCFGVALVLLAGCLTGEVAHRPAIDGHVVGTAVSAGACTAVDADCDPVLAIPLVDGRFEVPSMVRSVTLGLGADPNVGWSLVWACGPAGAAGALVGGSLTADARVEVELVVSGEAPVQVRSGDASRLPTEAEARARVLHECGRGR
jgi:hypothetical protein